MERIPILKMGEFLLVTIQVDMHDRLAMTLQDDLTHAIVEHRARGVLIDISALEIVDSFIGRMLANIAAHGARARRRDRRGRHAAGGGDHAGRARPVACPACGPRSTSRRAWRCSAQSLAASREARRWPSS